MILGYIRVSAEEQEVRNQFLCWVLHKLTSTFPATVILFAIMNVIILLGFNTTANWTTEPRD